MILYIRKINKPKFIFKLLNMFQLEKVDEKLILNIPIENTTRNKKTEKISKKLSKFLHNNKIKNIVLSKELMRIENLKKYLYNYNINILDGKYLDNFLTYDIIEKIYKYKGKKIEAGEVTILVNNCNEINRKNIIKIAQNIKRLNIITKKINSLKILVDYLYNELGIIVRVSSKFKANLESSDIILNIDFEEELVNKLQIPDKVIIVDIPNNLQIKTKKFLGANIKNWNIKIPKEYNISGFDEKILYEAEIYEKEMSQVFKQIHDDNIEIKNLVGKNGIINKKEFV